MYQGGGGDHVGDLACHHIPRCVGGLDGLDKQILNNKPTNKQTNATYVPRCMGQMHKCNKQRFQKKTIFCQIAIFPNYHVGDPACDPYMDWVNYGSMVHSTPSEDRSDG